LINLFIGTADNWFSTSTINWSASTHHTLLSLLRYILCAGDAARRRGSERHFLHQYAVYRSAWRGVASNLIISARVQIDGMAQGDASRRWRNAAAATALALIMGTCLWDCGRPPNAPVKPHAQTPEAASTHTHAYFY